MTHISGNEKHGAIRLSIDDSVHLPQCTVKDRTDFSFSRITLALLPGQTVWRFGASRTDLPRVIHTKRCMAMSFVTKPVVPTALGRSMLDLGQSDLLLGAHHVNRQHTHALFGRTGAAICNKHHGGSHRPEILGERNRVDFDRKRRRDRGCQGRRLRNPTHIGRPINVGLGCGSLMHTVHWDRPGVTCLIGQDNVAVVIHLCVRNGVGKARLGTGDLGNCNYCRPEIEARGAADIQVQTTLLVDRRRARIKCVVGTRLRDSQRCRQDG